MVCGSIFDSGWSRRAELHCVAADIQFIIARMTKRLESFVTVTNRESAMSRSWAAIAVIAAVSIGAFVSQRLTGDPVDQSSKVLAQAGGERIEGSEQPRARSGPKHGDVPLQHAILREEKEDSAESRILDALGKPTT